MKTFLVLIGTIVFIAVIGWAISFGDAEVSTYTFHHTQPYTDGMINHLEDLREQYAIAKTQEQKDAIKEIVRSDFASYPEARLNPDLRNFLDQMKGY